MLEITPTILTDNFLELKEMLKKAESFCDYVQIDIMDGKFVPSKSIEISDLKKIKTSLNLEVHLMVENPLRALDYLKRIENIKRVIFHYEAKDRPIEVIGEIKSFGLKAGLAISPETPVRKTKDLLGSIDSVLVLSVNPGFYGSKFIPQTLRKIKLIRKMRSDIKIGLDGGIKLNNLSKILNYPLDYLCVGSAILKEEDPESAFLEFKKLIYSRNSQEKKKWG